jgi:hypothetical protein
LKDLPWYVQFSLYLHTLKESSSSSSPSLDRTPWLESLPKSFDTPIHWTEAQRQEWLQYNAMVRSVARQETMWKTNYDTAKTAFAGLTWNDFLWGCETARSRAFSGSKAGKFNTGIYAFTLLLVAIYVGLGVGTLEEAANGAGVVLSATILKDFVLPKLFKKKVYVICPVIDMANHIPSLATHKSRWNIFKMSIVWPRQDRLPNTKRWKFPMEVRSPAGEHPEATPFL